LKDFVLGCFVAMSWCFEDEANKFTNAVLDWFSNGHALVPSIWTLEVANVILTSKRNKRITKTQSLQFVELLHTLPIVVGESAPNRAMGDILSLARQHNLSSTMPPTWNLQCLKEFR
jgi:predicted nucleic acid-binding protein